MMTILAIALFVAAFGMVALVIGQTLVPALPRIAALLTQDSQPLRTATPVRLLADRRERPVPTRASAPRSWREAA